MAQKNENLFAWNETIQKLQELDVEKEADCVKHNNMDKYIKVIETRIQSYKEALEFNEKFIRTDVDRDIDKSNFEKNLMGLLTNRIEIRERIDELEYVIQLLSMEVPEE